MTDTSNQTPSSETTPSQDLPTRPRKGRARNTKQPKRTDAAKVRPGRAETKQFDSTQPNAAYGEVKAALIKVYPEALTMDELITITGNRWKQAEILLATNHGALTNELLRDATYLPARYKINPVVVEIPNTPASVSLEAVAESAPQEVVDPPKATIIHKRRRALEMPEVKDAQPEKPARQPRSSGVFKEIVTCLVQSGEHLTVDEIREKTGLQSSKAVLNTTLSDRFAKKEIARDEQAKPFRYFVSDELKEKYTAQYGITGRAAAPPEPSVEIPVEQPVLQARPTVGPVPESRGATAVKPKEEAAVSPSGFDATMTLDGLLIMAIDGQTITLKPDWTRQLARLIRFMAE